MVQSAGASDGDPMAGFFNFFWSTPAVLADHHPGDGRSTPTPTTSKPTPKKQPEAKLPKAK